jgi:hypothetical protein
VKDYADRNGKLRSPNNSYILQLIKEWAMWAAMKYKGPLNEFEWMYEYNGEYVIQALRQWSSQFLKHSQMRYAAI